MTPAGYVSPNVCVAFVFGKYDGTVGRSSHITGRQAHRKLTGSFGAADETLKQGPKTRAELHPFIRRLGSNLQERYLNTSGIVT